MSDNEDSEPEHDDFLLEISSEIAEKYVCDATQDAKFFQERAAAEYGIAYPAQPSDFSLVPDPSVAHAHIDLESVSSGQRVWKIPEEAKHAVQETVKQVSGAVVRIRAFCGPKGARKPLGAGTGTFVRVGQSIALFSNMHVLCWSKTRRARWSTIQSHLPEFQGKPVPDFRTFQHLTFEIDLNADGSGAELKHIAVDPNSDYCKAKVAAEHDFGALVFTESWLQSQEDGEHVLKHALALPGLSGTTSVANMKRNMQLYSVAGSIRNTSLLQVVVGHPFGLARRLSMAEGATKVTTEHYAADLAIQQHRVPTFVGNSGSLVLLFTIGNNPDGVATAARICADSIAGIHFERNRDNSLYGHFVPLPAMAMCCMAELAQFETNVEAPIQLLLSLDDPHLLQSADRATDMKLTLQATANRMREAQKALAHAKKCLTEYEKTDPVSSKRLRRTKKTVIGWSIELPKLAQKVQDQTEALANRKSDLYRELAKFSSTLDAVDDAMQNPDLANLITVEPKVVERLREFSTLCCKLTDEALTTARHMFKEIKGGAAAEPEEHDE